MLFRRWWLGVLVGFGLGGKDIFLFFFFGILWFLFVFFFRLWGRGFGRGLYFLFRCYYYYFF